MMKIGFGYDVHRLVPERRLVLCGVEIPSEVGLLGHSDADVAVHAVMDAVLGALALGDIGKLFPDSDSRFKDADSMKLLEIVVEMMREKGFALGNLDVTIVAEKPKLAAYIQKMRENLARAFASDIENISVKATTEEGLGLAGEGIGAYAVLILENARIVKIL
ncbi:MAG: 2-C-methyl-D-erythritol 2,4-cyclodiphosphate synthase [Oscillospiraceae bacterium]|nr:2-C-methyl-D-erythritol 2,4-cyclodiphosphate synthase [Oscillospiraceae bacterium]